MKTDLTRRGFLQYLGAVTTIATLPGCAEEDGRVRVETAQGALSVTLGSEFPVLRAKDMLCFTLGLGDLGVQNGMLVTTGPGDGVLVLSFGPQHMLEGSSQGASAAPPTPVATRLSGESRIAFRVAQGTKIPFELEDILKHCAGAIPNVSDSARLTGASPPAVPPPTTADGVLRALLDAQRAAASSSEIDDEPIFDDASGVPVEPSGSETSIELPYRVALSPNDAARFSFSPAPIPAATRAELWHARLRGKSVRALWSYDPGFFPPGPTTPVGLANPPLSPSDRIEIVNERKPLRVRNLLLSALGGSLDLRGDFPDPGIIGWTHRATIGRDQLVRVEKVGQIFPWGHRTAIVRIYERKANTPFNASVAPPAGIRFRFELVVLDPVRSHSGEHRFFANGRLLPFRSVEIKKREFGVIQPGAGPYWWVEDANGNPVRFPISAVDLAGNVVRFDACAIFTEVDDPAIASGMASMFENNPTRCEYSIGVQRMAFAPPDKGDDTVVEARTLRFGAALAGDPQPANYLPAAEIATNQSVAAPYRAYLPIVRKAVVSIPALRQVAGTDLPSTFELAPTYAASGFDDTFNKGKVFLQVAGTAPRIDFSSKSERSGGAVNPDLVIQGVSRAFGPVPAKDLQAFGDIAKDALAGGSELFGLASKARLFGAIPLTDLLPKVDVGKMLPSFVHDALDAVGSFLGMVARVRKAIDDAGAAAGTAFANADAAVQAKAAELQLKANAVISAIDPVVNAIKQLPGDPNAASLLVDANGNGAIKTLVTKIDELTAVTGGLLGMPSAAGAVESELRILGRILDEARGRIADANAFVADAQRLAKAGQGITQGSTHLEWRPELSPISVAPFGEIFKPHKTNGLLLAADIRSKKIGDKPAGVDILFSLEDFTVRVLGDQTKAGVLDLRFKKAQFLMLAGKKPDVDVVFGGLAFKGVLGFIEPIRKIIPFDGFSDPPALTVDASGIKASFTQSLPNTAIGVFSLENVSLSAELHLPFIGESMTFGFDFCKREKPFKLVIGFLGGGGHFGMKLGMSGLVKLELTLQFGASLSMNLGVASGGITAMGGVSMALLQSRDVEITAWFRARGELEVLGLISAAIEVYLALKYLNENGCHILEGEATLTIEVSVAFFSTTVPLSFKRRFVGGNGDPTFAETITPQHWNEYCAAFAA